MTIRMRGLLPERGHALVVTRAPARLEPPFVAAVGCALAFIEGLFVCPRMAVYFFWVYGLFKLFCLRGAGADSLKDTRVSS